MNTTRRYIGVAAVALGLMLLPVTASTAKGLRQFDGLYCCYVPTNIGVTTSYLRFYPDGAVLATTSLGTPKDVVKWFKREKQPRYRYTVKGNSIRFDEKTDSLLFRYSGSVGGDSLTFRIGGHDRAQKRDMGYVERTYKFVPFSSIR